MHFCATSSFSTERQHRLCRIGILCVCPSVMGAGVVSKRCKRRSQNLYNWIAPRLYGFHQIRFIQKLERRGVKKSCDFWPISCHIMSETVQDKITLLLITNKKSIRTLSTGVEINDLYGHEWQLHNSLLLIYYIQRMCFTVTEPCHTVTQIRMKIDPYHRRKMQLRDRSSFQRQIYASLQETPRIHLHRKCIHGLTSKGSGVPKMFFSANDMGSGAGVNRQQCGRKTAIFGVFWPLHLRNCRS